MTTKQATIRKDPPAREKSVVRPAAESIAAKRERLHALLRDLRRDAEEMSANADKLLARFS